MRIAASPGRSRLLLLVARLSLVAAAGLALAFSVMLVASKAPSSSLRAFFLAPWSTARSALDILDAASRLGLCALGALVAFRAGHFTLGGDGQAYAGAFAAAVVGAGASVPHGPAGTAIAVGAAALAGAACSLPTAAARRFARADVLLTSFLSTQVIALVVDWAIAGPWRDAANNLVATSPVRADILLPRFFPPAYLGPAFPAFAVLVIALSLYLSRSAGGFALTMYGRNRAFATLKGYPVNALAFWPIVFAGAAHGLGGAALSLGANGAAVRGMTGGIGWTAIAVALVAGKEPLAVPFVAVLFAWLDSGARYASILSDVPVELSDIVKGFIFLVVTAKPAFEYLRTRRFFRRKERT